VLTLGPYVLYQRLGSGATAEVFLATGPNPRGYELLALKVMLSSLADARGSREIFLREARTSALLRHKHVVEIFEVNEVGGRPFIAMELVRGWSLSQLLKKMKEKGESFSVDEACELVRQSALGLHYIHEVRGTQGQVLGLIHRDVSPQNLIIDEEGLVKVVDFGLAKATAEAATQTGGLKGKLRYMAPEQLKGEGLDRRIDVFALGAILWELVCGTPLHPGPSEAEVFQQAFFNAQPHPDEVKRGLPRGLVEVLLGAVAREKGRRYPSALALAEALSPLAGVDVTRRIAERVQRHFERLPRSRAELEGPVAPARGPSKPPVQLPAPPGKVEKLGESFNEITEPALRPDALRASARDHALEKESNSAQTVMVADDGPRPQAQVIAPTRAAPPTAESPGLSTPLGLATGERTGLLTGDRVGLAAGHSGETVVGDDDAAVTLGPEDPVRARPSEQVQRPPRTLRDRPSRLMQTPLMRTLVARTGSQRGPVAAVGVLVGVSLMVGGFALSRSLFPPKPLVLEVAPKERPKWKSDLPPDDPELPLEPPPQAVPVEKAKPKLADKPPRKGGKGKVRFLTAEPAEVFIGKKRYGLSNELLTLPSGRHRVELVVPGGEKGAAIEVDVMAGTSSDLRVALQGN
jgi:serine/threonine protein kinase